MITKKHPTLYRYKLVMKLFICLIFQSVFLSISALHLQNVLATPTISVRSADRNSSALVLDPAGEAAPEAVAGEESLLPSSRSGGNAKLSGSAVHGSSAVVLDSGGEAALAVTGASLLPEVPSFSDSDELVSANESHHGAVAGVAGTVGDLHKLNTSVRTPLTILQLLDSSAQSTLRTLSWLARARSSSSISGVGLVVLLCCLLPAVILLLAITAPLWNKRASPSAEAAFLSEKERQEPRRYDQRSEWTRDGRREDPSGKAWADFLLEKGRQDRDSLYRYTGQQDARMAKKPEEHGSRWSSFSSMFGGDVPPDQAQGYVESDIICPELVVHSPRGAQFMLNGLFLPYSQGDSHELLRVNAYTGETPLLRIYSGENNSHHNGIVIELHHPGYAICLLDTTNAVNEKGKPPPEDRHVKIHSCIPEFRASNDPIAIVRKTAGSIFDVKKFDKKYGTSKVILRVVISSPSWGIAASVTDPSGILIASMTTAGQHVGQNRVLITMAQGSDAVMVVSALISACKLQ